MVRFSFELNLEQMEQFIHELPQALLVLDGEGQIRMANDVFLQASGYELSQIIGQPGSNLFPSIDHFADWVDRVYRLFKENDHLAETNWRDCQGRLHRSPMILYRGSDVQNRWYLLMLLHVGRNRLKSVMERFTEQLAHDVNTGIIVLNDQGEVLEISAMVCELFSIERTDILNRSINTLFQDMPAEEKIIQQTLKNGIVTREHAVSFRKTGKKYRLLMDSNVITDEAQNIIGSYIVLQDVTNFQVLEQKIQHNDRLAMIGQIAAGTAHEIRNPLTSVKGFLQMLGSSLEEKDMIKEKGYIDIMLTEIQRINLLVSEFLLLSKPKETEFQRVDLNVVFRELLPFVENEALLHGIDIEFKSAGKLPTVVGDIELLKQVFLNICKNALEAMENKGKLTITHTYDRANKKVSIHVEDTGPGIPEEVQSKIFDPFFTTKEEGTGLGLPICQKIVHEFGGEIQLSSSNRGTTFYIILPYI